jgi:hypothetical protein
MLFLSLFAGTHFSQCIASIQHQVGTIKGVEISYCDRDPLAFDLSIRLTQDGIKLVFDSLSQRLKVIEIYDLSLVRLKYWQVFYYFLFCFIFIFFDPVLGFFFIELRKNQIRLS